MALETGTYIDDLVDTNPTAADDVSQGDDHIRLLKSTIQASFPNITGAMTATQDDLNQIDNGQFAFPATQNPSADANTLDDYEEGTWTPTIQDTTESDAEGQTYSVQEGVYTKIGRVVYVTGYLAVTSIGTLTTTQQARIANLPFTVAANTRGGTASFGFGTSLNIAAGESVSGIFTTSATKISLQKWDAATGSSAMTVGEVSDGAQLYFSGFYFTT